MKILIHGNSPTAHTGYGVQIAHLARRLRDDGHQVAVSATYGQQATGRMWEGIQIYPCGYDPQGNDVIAAHAGHWFDGEPGWIIICTDIWVMRTPALADFNVLAWAPVDHFPVPPDVLGFFKRYPNARCAAMSMFGADLLHQAGVDAQLAPLSVDTAVFKPTPMFRNGDVDHTPAEYLAVDDDTFVVGMSAMNKDHLDRKGFNEAFRAFALFHANHTDSVLYVHADKFGMGTGLHLEQLAIHAGIPPHAIRFTDPYAILHGFTPDNMAALYSRFDVLLAPSKGEGFCVPLIEAQACGTPVIATDFSAQTELVGAGWKVGGQPLWDHSQGASYVIPFIDEITAALEQAYAADRRALARTARQFAAQYDCDRIYQAAWQPLIRSLEPGPPPELDRPPITGPSDVAVVIPAMRRPHNVAPLVASLEPDVPIYFVCDPDDLDEINAVKAAGLEPLISDRGHTYPNKVQYAYEHTTEPWLFVCGDDVRFHPGWIEAAAKLSDRFDVIGTNDSTDGTGNRHIASGAHADHFFVRRTYIDTHGASLDGPGVAVHEGYRHFFVDYELVKLAKARNTFTPCLDSIVEHLHPGLGKGQPDPVYQSFRSDGARADQALWESRAPLIEMQR